MSLVFNLPQPVQSRIKEVDGAYYPQMKGIFGWFTIRVSVCSAGDDVYSTFDLGVAKKTIDTYLERNHPKPKTVRYITYPQQAECTLEPPVTP